MDTLRVIITQGLAFGSIYAIAALGFALIYNTTRTFHIAYGAFAVIGAHITVSIAPAGPLPNLVMAVLVGVIATFVLTAFVFGVLYRAVEHRKNGQLAVFVISLGLAFAVEPALGLTRGVEPRDFTLPSYLRNHSVLGFQISYLGIVSIILGLGAIGGLLVALRHTRWGFQIQALASNPELATLVGTRRCRVMAGILLAAAGCGTVAAVFLGMYTTVSPAGGTNVALVAAIAVIAGGVGSYVGAYLFAMMTGFLQALMAFALPGDWTTVGVYGAILLLLLLRPSGLGRGWATAAV